jgi:hypothetical protein
LEEYGIIVWDTSYHDFGFSWFSSALPGWAVPEVRTLLLPSTSSPLHYITSIGAL